MKKLFLLIIPLLGFSNAWGEIIIQNDQKFVGVDGNLHITGEIKNELNAPLNQMEIHATLFSNGEQVGNIKDTPLLNTLMPKMIIPFELIFQSDKINEIDNYELDINYKITTPKNQVIEIVESDFTKGEFNNLVIKGKVANFGEITANTIVIAATLYDRDGHVAAVAKTHVEPDYLRADDKIFFFLSIPDNQFPDNIVDYVLVAESEEYTAVPEFPIGSAILLASSVSAYVFLTRFSNRFITNLISVTNLK